MRLVAGLGLLAAWQTAHAESPVLAVDAYPREVLARPTTYPTGLATAGLDASSAARSPGDRADIRVLAGLGLTDRLEINFGHHAFSTDRQGRGAFDVGLAADLAHLCGDLDFGVEASSGYRLATGELEPLALGVIGQYLLTDRLAVIAPGDQLAIGLDQPALALRLPLAVGYQASPLVFLQLDTTLASLDLGRGAASVMFADTTPLALTAFVNVVPTLDVFAGVSADLTPPDAPGDQDDAAPPQIADTLSVVVGARYYFGLR
jgi:hypothetical protein